MPRDPIKFGLRLSFLWAFWILFFQFLRIGEATVPGPGLASAASSSDPDSFVDPPKWALTQVPEFCLGVGNPSGINNKLHSLDCFPVGLWHLAETQASRHQQFAFQRHLRNVSWRSNRFLRCSLGAPAPLRVGSSVAGSWTGVLCFGDCPLRKVPCVWPSGEYHSGRVLVTVGQIGGLTVTTATLYCPPKGPTFPRATELSEELLVPITENLVFGRAGPRAILGDFNCPAGHLQQMRIWKDQGWIELQDLMQQKFGVAPRPTCKGSSTPDQIWLSPEFALLVHNVSIWNIYPDHAMLIAGIQVPAINRHTVQWNLPGHIPWTSVDLAKWENESDIGPILNVSSRPVGGHHLPMDSHLDFASIDQTVSTKAFRTWGRKFETQVTHCIQPGTQQADRSFYGRGRHTKPRQRKQLPPVPKHSRPGEVEQTCGFLNRASTNWFKQLRRLQSYQHAIRSSRSQENYHSRVALWQSILHAPGFMGGFAVWWPHRPHQNQGAPMTLPCFPPEAQISQILYDDFHHNYRRFEHYQWRRRHESCQAKLLATTKGLFAVTRTEAKYALDCLEDSITQPISIVDAHQGLVTVPDPFPSQGILHWTLQSQPAQVKKMATGYEIQSDLLLVEGQQLTCTTLVSDTSVIQERFAQLWSPRWTKHSATPAGHWHQILRFAEDHLPRGQITLPPLSVADWRRAVNSFKAQAATGPCGWTRADLVQMQDHHVQSILDFFSALEHGAAWPKQLCIGLVHSLQKRADSVTADAFRPITIMSLIYRVYTGIRAGQILSQLARWSDFMQCGFLRKRQASDIWYFVGICLEVSFQTATPVHGLVADLVKAYNTLPRTPAMEFLRILGVPSWFLAMWASHLTSFARHFVVRREVGPGLYSCTGFPEGCPLSCVAMTAVDVTWHVWQKVHTPRVLPMSYVDNLELLCDRVHDLDTSAFQLDHFCQLLDLSLDRRSLYAWSSTCAGRRELKQKGFIISLGNRDLGGQVTYCKQLRNKVLTDRIASVLPLFQKLRKTNLPTGVKRLNITQCIFPRALHGCEAVKLGNQHLEKLRAGVMRALHLNHAGASPVARLCLLEETLDPEWYQLQHVVKLFRHQSRSNHVVQDWWKLFHAAISVTETNGPFGKLSELLQAIGLTLDEECRLWFSAHGFVDLLRCSWTVIQWVLRRQYQNCKAAQLSQRAGFDGLQSGCDIELTKFSDKSFGLGDQAHLMTARDGSFTTDKEKAKFDTRISATCVWCNQPATQEHKFTTCSKYDHVRAQHSEVFTDWDSLPEAFRQHGLVPSNPWIPILWESLITLPSGVDNFQFGPVGSTVHCFTDGTASQPHSAQDSLAAWSVVVAQQGPVAWGPLPGIQQSVPRAEAYAILSTMLWIESFNFQGSVHLWVDNQGAVDHTRDILRGTFNPSEVDHEDIWSAIATRIGRISAEIVVHKVASHDLESNCESPLEDFARVWNEVADRQAAVANLTRPSYFNEIWNKHQTFRQQWKRRVQGMTKLQKAIADMDCHANQSNEEEIEPEVSFEFVLTPNSASLSVRLGPWVDNDTLFTPQHDSHFRTISAQFLKWLVDQDAAASCMRTVSLIELFVAFRLSREGCGPISDAEGGSRFLVVTFASDFSYFKRIARLVFKKADISLGTKVALTSVGIIPPQEGVQCGWPTETAERTLHALRDFVGARVVANSQALAKPWFPEGR